MNNSGTNSEKLWEKVWQRRKIQVDHFFFASGMYVESTAGLFLSSRFFVLRRAIASERLTLGTIDHVSEMGKLLV